MYIACDINGIRWKIREEYRDLFLAKLAPNFGSLLRRGEEFKTRSPARVVSIELDDQVLKIFVKIYRYLGFKNYIRRIQIKREWQIVNWAFSEGISTAPPVAFGVKGGRFSDHEGYLLVEAIEGSQGLLEFLSDDTESGLRKRWATIELARIVKQMHFKGILHNDLCPSNILVRLMDEGLRLYVIDFYNARIKKRLSKKQRFKNLAKIDRHFYGVSSRTDRLRFFKEYSIISSKIHRDDKSEIKKIFEEIQALNLREKRKGWRKKLGDFAEEFL
jgi:tRNA A-37 threonylcarbamoyl transferase component Bud32